VFALLQVNADKDDWSATTCWNNKLGRVHVGRYSPPLF
jgi:hypothetical protein